MEIRLASQSDAAPIIAFDHVAQQQRARVNFIYRAITSRSCYVAVVEQGVVAYGVLEYSFFEHGFISMLYVHPEHRRRGIGYALLEHIERVCKTPKLFTSTDKSNKAMQALLAKRNYAPSGTIKNLGDEGPEQIFFKQVRPSG